MIISMADILNKAKAGGYGVAAPNVFNDSTVAGAFQVADTLKSPLILGCVGIHNMELVAEVARFYERKYPHLPIALHLDHGSEYTEIMAALRYGFSSVMIDRSILPFDENVREVKEVVKTAHSMGVSVEAELGHVGVGFEYEETRNSGLTKLEEAVDFVEQTDVDCLAVAVGTSHGVYKGAPKLEFELLAQLSEAVEVPLVLHGGSGTGDDALKKAVQTGIQKVNLYTDLYLAGLDDMKKYMGVDFDSIAKDGSLGEFGNKSANMFDAIMEATVGWKAALSHYVHLFGSCNKA